MEIVGALAKMRSDALFVEDAGARDLIGKPRREIALPLASDDGRS